MTPERRSNLIQKIIKILQELERPSWFKADRILKDVVEPELQETKDHYEKLFFADDSDNSKH
jgi:hypothetical protein